MKTLHYSFAQIEAFATIAETGSLSRAAIRLGKDRTTLRDLLDYLEDALGYALFLREGRSLALTAEGEQLFRQAHLLLRQAQAFESFAQTLPRTAHRGAGAAGGVRSVCTAILSLRTGRSPCPTSAANELLERIAPRGGAGAGRRAGRSGYLPGQ